MTVSITNFPFKTYQTADQFR